MRKIVTVDIFNIVWNDEEFYKLNDEVSLNLPDALNSVAVEVTCKSEDDIDEAVQAKLIEYLSDKYDIDTEEFDWEIVCTEDVKEAKENNMAKNKKKVQEQTTEHIVIVEPKNENNVAPVEEVVEVKEVSSKDIEKAQELLQVAVNEVVEGIIPLGELLKIALRKVRATSVLTKEEDKALNTLHIEVIVEK